MGSGNRSDSIFVQTTENGSPRSGGTRVPATDPGPLSWSA
jgi:hypothetical protein